MVQLGFLRLSMNPAAMAPNFAATGAQAHALLARLVADSADKGLIQHHPGIVEPLRI